MKYPHGVWQFLNGLLICVLPSLVAYGHFAVGLACALVSPLFCAWIFPLCRTDRKLWLFIWVTMALTVPDLMMMREISPLLSMLLHGAVQPVQLYIPVFLVLYAAQQIVYYAVLRLLQKHKAACAADD